MTLDLSLAALVLLFAAIGLWRGAIAQLAHLGGLVVAVLAAQPLGRLVGPLLAERGHWPPLLVSVAATFVCFLLVYLVTALALRALLRQLVPDGENGALNRTGGLLLGAAKTALVLYVLLSAVVFVERPLLRLVQEPVRVEWRQSQAVTLTRHHNLFALEELKVLREALLRAERGATPATGAALAEDPRLQALAEDDRIHREAAEGDFAGLLTHPRVQALLADPRFNRMLGKQSEQAASQPAE